MSESTTPVYLAIYGCCRQWFMCHFSYVCICLDHELGRDSVHAHMQLSHVHLASTLYMPIALQNLKGLRKVC